jgi:ATP-dependent RNA circularization protein (DNA/RNA ligase family)
LNTEYCKIQTVFKRALDMPRRPLIIGDWTLPIFEYLAYNTWEFTEKVDGTNVRVIFDTDITFQGRTDTSQLPSKLFKRLTELFPPSARGTFATKFTDAHTVVLYGEGYGPGIQKAGAAYRDDLSFVLFDVKAVNDNGTWWLGRKDVEDVAATFGLDVVPIVGSGTLYDAIEMVQEGFVSRWGDFISEGVVARPAIELVDRHGERIITKIKHRDFEFVAHMDALS